MRGREPTAGTHVIERRERALRWAVRLGLTLAALLVGGGIAIPVVFRVGGRAATDVLLFSPRVDEILFGSAPAEVIASEPAVKDVQLFYLDLACTVLLALGVLIGFLTWFGVRAGHRWAWWGFFVSYLVATASLARVVIPYLLKAPFGFADVPPIFWVPVLAPLLLALGWQATKRAQ